MLFDWDRDGLTDHVGIVEANLGDGWLQTIEGNTSPSNAGSQSAGNGVYRRQRYFGIDCVLRPKWSDAGDGGDSDGADSLTDKWWGSATTYALQASMNVPANGWIETRTRTTKSTSIGLVLAGIGTKTPMTVRNTIAELQRRLDIEADGIAGPDTVSALQQHLRNRGHELDVDGYCGYRTVECLQYELVNGTLWG